MIDLILNLKETGQMAFFQKAEGSLNEDEDVRHKETAKNVEEACSAAVARSHKNGTPAVPSHCRSSGREVAKE